MEEIAKCKMLRAKYENDKGIFGGPHCVEFDVELHKVNLMASRLSYFVSADFCSYEHDKLIEFEAVINSELFEKWERLLDELDVVHQMYLYSLSDSKVTIDVKCAFLIELAEPLIEIVKEHTKFFSSLNPGERGTTLKNCIDALITKYGEENFAREISSAYDKFFVISKSII